jgi:hypothetical protein
LTRPRRDRGQKEESCQDGKPAGESASWRPSSRA